MKMIYLTCNISILSEVIKILEENQVRDFQVIKEATGRSVKGNPRLNTPVWPGYNAVVIMPIPDDEKANSIINIFKKFNKKTFNEDELITCCSWSLENYFYD